MSVIFMCELCSKGFFVFTVFPRSLLRDCLASPEKFHLVLVNLLSVFFPFVSASFSLAAHVTLHFPCIVPCGFACL